MIKRCLSLLALCLLISSQAIAGTVGLAQAKKSFQIDRGNDQLSSPADTPMVISQGDRVSATDSLVQITSTSGENLLLAPRSSASFAQEGVLELHNGEMALGVSPATQRTIQFNGLEVGTLKAEGNEKPAQLVMRAVDENEVLLAGFGEPFAVRDTGQGIQVAVLGSQEALRLVKDQLGQWKPLPLPLRMQGPDDTGTESDALQDESVQESDDDDEAGFWIFSSTATGVAVLTVSGLAIGAGSYFAYEEITDDDDDDDDDDDFKSNPPRFRATTISPNQESPSLF